MSRPRPIALARLLLVLVLAAIAPSVSASEPVQEPVQEEEGWGDEWFDEDGAEAARAIERAMVEEAVQAIEPAPAPTPTNLEPATALEPERTLILPRHRPADLEATWRSRREAHLRQDEAAAREAERRLFSLLRELDVAEVHAFAHAAIRESQRLEKVQSEEALRRAELAVQLAPSLPAAHRQLLRARLLAEPGDVQALATTAWNGLRAGISEPRGLRLLALDLAVATSLALALAGAVILLLLAATHLRAAMHDFHHRFPSGVSRIQSTVFAGLLVATPCVLGLGPVVPAALILAGIWRQLLRGERLVLGAWLIFVCLLPTGAARLATSVEWESTPAATIWAVERLGDFSRLGQLRELAARPDAPPEALFAAARARKRLGELEAARTLYERALHERPRWAAALNNLGNVLFLQGDLDGAATRYGKAIDLEPGLAVAHYNLSRVHYDRLDLGAGQRARARATSLDPGLADRYTADGDRRRANRWVIDATLDGTDLGALAWRTAPEAEPVAEGLAARLVAPVAPTTAASMGAGLIGMLAIAPAVVGRRRRAAASCRRCGRPVCPTCDPEVGDGRECGQCLNVFEGRVRTDEDARDRKEREVRTHEARRSILRWVAGGTFTAPFLEGRLVPGVLVAFFGWLAVLLAVMPQGVVAPPWEAVPASWKWALLSLPIAACALTSIRSARRRGWP